MFKFGHFANDLRNTVGVALASLPEEHRLEYAAIIDQESKRLSTLTMQLLLSGTDYLSYESYGVPVGGSIEIGLTVNAMHVSVTFLDTGIGIAPTSLLQVFDRFFREDEARKNNGTGLGLAIVQQIVTLHNGDIRVNSTPGEGSVFTVSFPSDIVL